MSAKPVRTRFAPSPTGYLHVGGARTALFNYLYARATGGSFILRIEDTDVARSTEESYHLMIESMQWLGLDWDEGPEKGGPHGSYRQSERLSTYVEHAEKLVKDKKAYYCFCSNEELENKKKKREAMGLPPVYDGKCRSLSEAEIQEKKEQMTPHVIRFRMPSHEVVVKDVVQGNVHFDASLIGDFIIVKSNGYPSYNFAVVVDDYLMEINYIIRGVGHLSNTPRQIVIYDAFGWEEPVWAHVSEIVGSDHKKLSKRHGAAAITAFRDLGYPAEAFLNYMALLGWSPPDGKEFMETRRIIEQFDIARCGKSPSMFDVFDMKIANDVELNDLSPSELEQYIFQKSKLNWLSNLHIRARSEEQYIEEIFPFVERSGKVPADECKIDNENLRSILLSLRVYLDNYHQIGRYIGDFFTDFSMDENAREWLSDKNRIDTVKEFYKIIDSSETFNNTSIKENIKQTGENLGVGGKELFMTIRCGATGKMTGLELPDYLSLLGKEKVTRRLSGAIDQFKE